MKGSTPIVLLFGGMGNRLFQIARAWDLKQKGYEPLVINIEELPALYWFLTKLLKWSQHPLWINTLALCERVGLESPQPSFSNRIILYRAVFGLLFSDRKAQFNIPLSQDFRSVHIGYFQSAGCITKESTLAVANAICDLFALKPGGQSNAVVHIRGGDFAFDDRLSDLTVTNFIKYNPETICVTNDVRYVAAKFPALDISHSEGAKEDFITLTNAKVILPSNSTFCFWACVIASHKNGAKLWSLPADEYWKLITE